MATPKTKLEMIRRQMFLSQKEVAEQLDMSSVNYSKIERGERRLTVDVAKQLVQVFNLNYIDDLLDDAKAS
ncbi:helix-turn-helix domain-containing protein [Paenibacillus xylanexedens]|uniref:Transcriptional regulator with XRE-family HTH domain n=1 Tax=Paenibacillus xylanexedens TaxID=528191 RepID=A0ABS4RLW1_PAEXY|nr:helix-turn-helix transcriptional regulator [Paenibacillus xylanexedens]MBP2243788.1 transcriptional regulator with XRE-family HTH domain [Paenibacillus xylanexedens]